MKKPRVKRFVLMAVGVGALAIVAGLCWLDRPFMNFRFLDGHKPTWHRRTGQGSTLDYYRFEGHFEDVYAKAAAELTALGFRESSIEWAGHYGPAIHDRRRSCLFELRRPDGLAWVAITGGDGTINVRVRSTRAGIRERLRRLIRRLKRI